MRRPRSLRLATGISRALAVGLAATLAVVLFASACKPEASAVGPGGECFLATDCAPGLICIEQPNKTRICSDDLSSVAGRPPPEDGPAEVDGGEEGGMPDGETPETSTPIPDTGTPDTAGPPPDTGSPEDSGTDA